MLLEKDSRDDEATCLGVATACDAASGLQSYEGNAKVWVLRCYNGTLYSRGAGGGSASERKVHPGDRVRFSLDRRRAQLSATIVRKDGGERRELGAIFTTLPPPPEKLYPLVVFYSGGARAVRLTHLSLIHI